MSEHSTFYNEGIAKPFHDVLGLIQQHITYIYHILNSTCSGHSSYRMQDNILAYHTYKLVEPYASKSVSAAFWEYWHSKPMPNTAAHYNAAINHVKEFMRRNGSKALSRNNSSNYVLGVMR